MGLALLSACSPSEGLLTPTPANFAAPEDRAPVNSAEPVYPSNDLNLLYVTDRAPIADPQTNALSYGSERSRTMSFGSIDIRIESDSSEAMGEMKLGGIKEIGRFPEVPYSAVISSAGYRRAPAVVAAHEEAVASLQGEIRNRLAKTERKEVVVFIHGYNNSFADAANAMGSICHLLGGGFRLRLADVAGRWIARRFLGLQRRPRIRRVRRRRHAEGDPRDRSDRGRARSRSHRPQPRH